ncbi:hypothetical protein LPJ61_002616 [Coemansia biformis]|uniref:Uncharacterized protein n=1 Tax=Coemansia biformis TaxID=1286918 RepID=A0A9W8CZ07_9FUNG|nr:hypothetical protein LPJ61_002616 [Coemansia biformis]
MQFAKILVAIAAIAAAVVADVDWTSPEAIKCTKENWSKIKATADPLLPLAGGLLSPEQKKALDSLLNGQSTLPANPSDDFLRALPQAIPPALLERVAGKEVSACIAALPPASSAPASVPASSVPASEPASEPASSVPASEPATSGPVVQPTPPPKCQYHA